MTSYGGSPELGNFGSSSEPWHFGVCIGVSLFVDNHMKAPRTAALGFMAQGFKLRVQGLAPGRAITCRYSIMVVACSATARLSVNSD